MSTSSVSKKSAKKVSKSKKFPTAVEAETVVQSVVDDMEAVVTETETAVVAPAVAFKKVWGNSIEVPNLGRFTEREVQIIKSFSNGRVALADVVNTFSGNPLKRDAIKSSATMASTYLRRLVERNFIVRTEVRGLYELTTEGKRLYSVVSGS